MKKINIVNNVPGLKVVVNGRADGGYEVSISQENSKRLGDFACGSVVKIGEREYIVLDHSHDTTALITKDFVKDMSFGNNGDWRGSAVRKFCNGEFYKELAQAVGEANIVEHTVKLDADDGTGKREKCRDKVSLLTTELYRRYREFLPAYGKWWWLTTRVSHGVNDYARYVCRVDSNGVLDWYVCDFSSGVRPFCILNSSISVQG